MGNNDYGRKDKRLAISFKTSSVSPLCKDLNTYIYGDTIDELIDGLEMLANGNFAYNFFCRFRNLTQPQLERLDKIMLNDFDNNFAVVFEYVCIRKEKLNYFEKFRDKFIKINKKEYIYSLAKIFQDEELKEAFLTPPFSDGGSLCRFVEEFGDIYLQRVKDIIFDSKMKFQAYRICQILQKHGQLTSDDILIAEELVKETKAASTIKAFAENIKGAHILELEDAFVNSNDAYQNEIWEFAHIPGADIDKLRALVERRGYSGEISNFEKDFGKRNKPKRLFNFKK